MNTQAITSLMSNADLDVWADIYAQAKIGELVTVPLSQFLLDPWTHLSGAGQESAIDCINTGHRPLLPAQVRASKAIHAEWADQDRRAATSKRSHLSLVSSQ